MGHAYHVIEYTPGYLPESEPGIFSNKRDAESYAVGLAKELREYGYRVTGSARKGGYDATDPNRTHDLGRSISIEMWPVEESEGPS